MSAGGPHVEIAPAIRARMWRMDEQHYRAIAEVLAEAGDEAGATIYRQGAKAAATRAAAFEALANADRHPRPSPGGRSTVTPAAKGSPADQGR